MNYPIILVPGLLASMGDDIVSGTGDFDFGLAQYAYEPMLENLQTMGFKRDQNLFVAFYDWRKQNRLSAEKYLIPTIEKAKNQTGSKKVNLVCHSMGGLVARAYIQSNLYKYDVDKLIMIGTPNAGAVKAYYFWQGGEIPSNEGFGNLFHNLLWEGYTWLHKIFKGLRDSITVKRQLVPSVKELLPSKNYGDFLFTVKNNSYGDFIPQDRMVEQNTFLNDLNNRFSEIYKKGVNVYSIVGNGVKTERFIRVVKNNRGNSPEWIDGKPDDVVYTDSGDGTVITESATAIYGKTNYIQGDHLEILKNCKDTLAMILNKRIHNRRRFNNTRKKHSLCTILARNSKEIYMESKGRKVDIKSIQNRRYGNLVVNNIGKSISSIIINLEEINNVKITFIPMKDKKSNILVLKRSDTNDINERNEIQTSDVFTLEI